MSDPSAEDNELIPEATKDAAATIKPIAKDTVHKICSGQVVLSLAVAVKELVENAIDAGATLVEVKLCEQGLEYLEVSDNGSGVEEHNLKAMTAKYHTSKLREFVDLQGVETFGFRGEALSSLCALTDMQIITRHKNAEAAIKIDLDHEGNVREKGICARSVGTTVKLVNIFTPLPVRRRDFVRNIKKEFNKMCTMLQAYCLMAVGVRIICSNTTTKGNKTTILQTHGVGDILANVTSIFGSKQTNSVMRLKSPYDDSEDSVDGSNVSDMLKTLGESMQVSEEDLANLNEKPFQLEGYISSCSHGAGRAAKDRQFFYVNSRPCDSKNLSKVVNDMYHRYNGSQFPFVLLNVKTARADVDVNLTPDKRQLLINNEKLLLLALKQALVKTYGSVPSTYNVQNASIVSMWQKEAHNKSDRDESHFEEDILPTTSTSNYAFALKGLSGGVVKQLGRKRKCVEAVDMHTKKLKSIEQMLTQGVKSKINVHDDDDDDVDEKEKKQKKGLEKEESYVVDSNSSVENSPEHVKTIVCVNKRTPRAVTNLRLKSLEFQKNELNNNNEAESKENNNDSSDEVVLCSQSPVGFLEPTFAKAPSPTPDFILDGNLDSDVEMSGTNLAAAEWCITMSEIEERWMREQKLRCTLREKTKLQRLRFKSKISPVQNSTAEAELQKEITKEDFGRMQILGQFNLGFIIVRLDGDLFIVDQHASDEKYNFEMLQRETVLQYQKLANPQPLELTAVNELVLMQHLAVFERNGFKFDINENATTTTKVRLLGKPFSKNWEFGKEDIDELIFMLQDAPEGTECRPSRIRAMFASRACRKSVMIGTALTKATMRNLIRHMGEIEQPWNCPHGRPTMRHLINTDMLMDNDMDS